MKNLWSKLKSYKFDSYMLVITIFYAIGSLLINLMAVKTLGYNDMKGTIISITTAGTIISWLVFACMDVVTEVSGKKKAIQTFWITGVVNLIVTAVAALVVFIPGVSQFTSDAYKNVFAGNWGIALASMTAFLIGNYVNAIIIWSLKVKAKNKTSSLGFTFRVAASTLIGQFLDNAIFYIIALAPQFGLGGLTNPACLCGYGNLMECWSGAPFISEYVWNTKSIAEGWKQLWMMVGFTTLIEMGVEAIVSPLIHKFTQFLLKKKESEGIIDEAVALNNK